jgi:hypothetical protein
MSIPSDRLYICKDFMNLERKLILYQLAAFLPPFFLHSLQWLNN